MRGIPFFMPHIVGTQYAPGPQPNSPGESHQPWAGHMGLQFVQKPWPYVVPVLNALANFSGIPRDRAPVPVVNRFSPLPTKSLFIAGVVSKSQG